MKGKIESEDIQKILSYPTVLAIGLDPEKGTIHAAFQVEGEPIKKIEKPLTKEMLFGLRMAQSLFT